jgi:hypothetical protein
VVTPKTMQVRTTVRIHTGSQRMALMRVLFCLALCAFIAGIAPIAAASYRDAALPQQMTRLRRPYWMRNPHSIATPVGQTAPRR